MASVLIALPGCGTNIPTCQLAGNCGTSNPTAPARPSGTSFDNAPVLEFDANGNATFTGTITSNTPDVYDLGAGVAGDRIVVTVDPAAGDPLDPTAALFNAAGELLANNDDVNLEAGLVGSHIDMLISAASDHVYLGIAKYYYDANGGRFDATVRIEHGGTFARPPVQYLLLGFAGGTVTLPTMGTLHLGPFDAADVDPAYTGKTAQIKAGIAATVAQNYRNTGLVIVTSDEPPPPAGQFSTVYFGSFSATLFGLAEGVDVGNVDPTDNAVVFTDDFDKPFATQPSADGLAVAIGNVASHEAGHLFGLNHVSNIADLMDNTGTASTLLADQEFITSTLSPSIFPIGVQNGPMLLDRVIPE